MPGKPSADEVRARVAAFPHWYHRLELAPGLVTPGVNDSSHVLSRLDALGLPRDFAGLRVLDLGCRDGFFSFEAERRGAATVIGVDYAEAACTGFPIAAEILGSAVEFRRLNLYDIDPEKLGTFDVVFFLGLLYHLRDPLLALDRIRAMQKPGGLLYVETQLATDPLVLGASTPLWQFFPGASLAGDATNCWGPNLAGLAAAVEASEYSVLRHEGADRAILVARAVEDGSVAFYRDLDRGLRASS
jgi:tRNA (mo5U34)-methyltransferase